MDAERLFQPSGVFKSKIIASTVACIGRLTLAVCVALVALIGLCERLAAAGCQAQAYHKAAAARSLEDCTGNLCVIAPYGSTRCRRPTLDVTGQIDPADPDTGGVATNTFVVSGVGFKPVDVVLVHDISGSMLENDTLSGHTRLEDAQEAAITLVNQLEETDRIAVVAFSETVPSGPVLPLTTDTDAAIAAIHSLEAQTGWLTNIGGGIQSGYEELISSTRWISGTAKAIILLSDGQTSRPNGDPEGYARDQARAAGECGILIYTVGLGEGVNGALMQDIASLSGGEYYFSPDGSDIATIYREIALELRNLVITDVLVPGVAVDCSLWPAGACSQEDGLTTTVVLAPGNGALATDPLIASFPITVNLDPGYEGPVSTGDSSICYDGPGGWACQSLESPIVTVGGRKITGVVFEDLDRDGHFDADESGLSGVGVTTSNGLTSVTDSAGVYTLRTSVTPELTVAVNIPPGFVSTTSPIGRIPSLSGTYGLDFGLYPSLDGILLDPVDVEPSPEYHGDLATIGYSVVNLDQEHGVMNGTILIVDSIGRTFDGGSFELAPGETTIQLSSTFSVPQDIGITLTASGDIQGMVPVSDQFTLMLCPEDIYEPDDVPSTANVIYGLGSPFASSSQLHDFHGPGDEDWVAIRLHPGDRGLFAFNALPLDPNGSPICLDLYGGGAPVTVCNLDNPKSPVEIVGVLSCGAADLCDYFLHAQSPSSVSGCGTDYRLSVEGIPWSYLHQVFLPAVQWNSVSETRFTIYLPLVRRVRVDTDPG